MGDRPGVAPRVAAVLVLLCDCVATGERWLAADLERARATLAELPGSIDEYERVSEPVFDGTPEGYVAYALANHGGLRASWERWRAAIHRIARERRLPMPMLSYAMFVTSMKPAVGVYRIGVRQTFPWPGELLAGADAASAEARAMQREFEAAALDLRAAILEHYWQLWLIRRLRTIQRDQLGLLGLLEEAALARLAVGRTSVAEVEQIQLAKASLETALLGVDEAEIQARASLLAAIGAPADGPAPTLDSVPELERPRANEASLREVVAAHPRLLQWREQERSSEERVREAKWARAPIISAGVDWMRLGPMQPGMVALGVDVELPLWQLNYREDQRAAAADAAAARAEWTASFVAASGELAVALSSVRDTARRAALHEDSLVPKAETVLSALLADYASGRGELASILLAENSVLDLRMELARLQAGHAIAWAELERVVGQPVDAEAAYAQTP